MSEKACSGAAFAYVTTLSFAWGFVASVIDPLVVPVKAAFHLNYTEAMLPQFAWFIAYGVASQPSGAHSLTPANRQERHRVSRCMR